MTSDGHMLVLDKAALEELISAPLIKTVHPNVASTMRETGYNLIDVRYSEEYDAHHIPGAMPMSLYELRIRVHGIDKHRKCIVYCDGGTRSAVATLIGVERLTLCGRCPASGREAPPTSIFRLSTLTGARLRRDKRLLD